MAFSSALRRNYPPGIPNLSKKSFHGKDPREPPSLDLTRGSGVIWLMHLCR
jgi:hypothetical protein